MLYTITLMLFKKKKKPNRSSEYLKDQNNSVNVYDSDGGGYIL